MNPPPARRAHNPITEMFNQIVAHGPVETAVILASHDVPPIPSVPSQPVVAPSANVTLT